MRRVMFVALSVLALVARPAAGDVVSDWNVIVFETLTASPRPGPSGLVDVATVHLAIHDAIQAFEHEFSPYHVSIRGAKGSAIAAVAKAAHDVLASRFPSQATALADKYQNYLSAQGIPADDPGVKVGEQVAAGINALRGDDGMNPPGYPPFNGGTDVGDWRPTAFTTTIPPTPLPMVAPWLAAVKPFTMKSNSQFRPGPPPPLNSNRYARDYNEIKNKGGSLVHNRTAEETDVAHFFSDNAIAYWNRSLRTMSSTYLNNISDSGRLFALVNMAMADSLISSWEAKIHYNLWRPLTAIQEGDNDGNHRTAGDPTWLSLITTPNYPDYTSGANHLGGSATRMLKHFFKTDKKKFSMTSTAALALQKERQYERFSDAADDIVDARVFEGIHFRFADEAGRAEGKRVANWAFERFLTPRHHGGGKHHHGDHDDDED